MTKSIFWDIRPYGLLKVTDVSKEHVASIFRVETNIVSFFKLDSRMEYSSSLKIEATCTSETAVDLQRIAWRYVLEQWYSTYFFVRAPPDVISLQL
jgi:hypothetical protein